MNTIIEKNLNEIKGGLEVLETSQVYDAEKLSYALVHQIKQLEYFYCHISKDNINKSYSLKRRPQENQLAYFNIGRGFPKELMDGHWCFILKDWGSKMLVIPATSIKTEEINNFELDIHSYNNSIDERISRLQFSDIRAIDVQRIDERKIYYSVSQETIVVIYNKLNEILF